jgi:lipopolysaccharide export system protein LptA
MSRRSCRNSLTILAALFLLAAAPAPFAPEKGKREPIVVTSKRMEAEKLGDTVTFIGDVVLKKEAMTMNADRLIVHYDPPAKDIREIDALGNVVVTQEGRVALGEKAVYYSREEKLVLTGDARIIENENQLGGDRIILYLRENRSMVEGGKVLFYQNKTGDGKSRSPLMKIK